MTRSLVLVVLVAPTLLSACKDKLTDKGPMVGDDDDDDTTEDDDDDDTAPEFPFVSHVVDEISAPRHALATDLDEDGTPELLVSSLGVLTDVDVPPGLLSLFWMDGALDEWVRADLVNVGDAIRYPGAPLVRDLDGDGDRDILLPSGGPLCEPLPEVDACGALHWLENTGDIRDTGSWTLHEVVTGSLAFFSSAQVSDLNDDGWLDILVVAERFQLDAQAGLLMYVPGTGPGTFQTLPLLLALGGGPWPYLEDMDGDGDQDVLVGEWYSEASFAWYEHVPTGEWPRHVIADDLGKGYRIFPVDDLYGDGETRLVATNHTNTQRIQNPDLAESQVVAFSIPGNPTGSWSERDTLSEGIEVPADSPLLNAPGDFVAGDADSDGDLDLVVAGAGDPRVYLLEQTDEGTFATRVLGAGVGRSGGTDMADFDGDGDLEIVVVSERDDVVLVLEYR